MYDIIIIGAGPAGISCSLYAKRAGANVLILYHGTSNLEKAIQIDNYYGFEEGITGEDLYRSGIKQAQNLGVELKNEEVLGIEQNETSFSIRTLNQEYTSKSIVIATGNKKLRPNIDGVLEFEGKGISYCAICDGFFYRGKNVAVIGNGDFALSEASELKNVASKVTILTNGDAMENQSEFDVCTKKITAICGEAKVNSVEFADGTSMNIDGIFIALGEAGSSDFARKMGVMLNGDNIIVDENMKTNIDGLYACGNSTGGLLQVCKAVYEGAKAGLSATSYIKNV